MRLPFRRKALRASPAVLEAVQDRQANFGPLIAVGPSPFGGTNERVNAAWVETVGADYWWTYSHQPAVRTVIDFLARNVAQLALRLYERAGDNERLQRSDHGAAQTMAHPNDVTPPEQFIFNAVADYLLNGRTYIFKFPGPNGRRELRWVPAFRVGVIGRQFFQAEGYRVWRSDGSSRDFPPDGVIDWHSYNPIDPRIGVSPIEALKKTLAEDAAAQQAGVELSKGGLAPPGYVYRPGDAPDWSDQARARFEEDWANRNKSGAMKTPVLEEGMEFRPYGFTPKDAEMLDGRRFTLEQVASIYGVPGGLVGVRAGESLEEQHRIFYQDVLPPLCETFAGHLDLGLVEAEYGDDDLYFEFDLDEKLQGDDRLKALVSAAGAPVMLRNEARAKLNLPPVDGGDELVTPLNVLVGDNPKPSPMVMPPQNPIGPPQDGSHREELPAAASLSTKRVRLSRFSTDLARQARFTDEAKATFTRYYHRQERIMRSKDLKAADTERWDGELADKVYDLVRSIVEKEGNRYVAHLAGDDFDMRRVENYLRAMSEGVAGGVNAATQRDIEDTSRQEAFERAHNVRVGIAAASVAASATVFARREAAKQAPQTELRRQVWVADTDRHGDLDGAEAPLDGDWGGIEPGSEVNCQCTASIL